MRIHLLTIAMLLAVAEAASARPVLQYEGGGRLVTKEEPALPPPEPPPLAVPGGEEDCPLPPTAAKPSARAAGSSSVTKAIARARRRGTISGADATRYRSSYSKAIHA